MLILYIFISHSVLTSGYQQRILSTWMVDDDGCYEIVLSNSLPVSNITLVPGIVFSLQNTGGSAVDVSSLSIYLDQEGATPSVEFELYTMNGDYVAKNSIGTVLDGSGDWKPTYKGTLEDTLLDDDEATFLGSFGGKSLQLQAGEIMSIYLRFTESVLKVSQNSFSVSNADKWDGNVETLNDFSMQISVGRAVSTLTLYMFCRERFHHLFLKYAGVSIYDEPKDIFWLVVDPNQFDEFYSPSIVPCKLWSKEECPPNIAPTMAPTMSNPPTTTPIIENATIVNNFIDLSFAAGTDGCSFDADVIYKLLGDSLDEFAISVYKDDPIGTTNVLGISITFNNHEDVSTNGEKCSVVRFYYDVQIKYAIAECDETPPIELILLPLSTDSRREEFLSIINSNAGGIPPFSTLSTIGPVVVTQEGLRTRSPTISPTSTKNPTPTPTISALPSSQHSITPTLSQMPSSSPIIAPSSQPTSSLSSFPSSTPTTELNAIQTSITPQTVQNAENDGSQSVLRSTGVVVIVVCLVVVVIVVFFVYKAIERIKAINEDPFYDVEGTNKPDQIYSEVDQDTNDYDEPDVILPLDQADTLNTFESRLWQKATNGESSTQDQSNSSAESFERRLRKKIEESTSKLTQPDRDFFPESFEQRLRKRAATDKNTPESFEERLRRKTETNAEAIYADSNSLLGSFDERLKKKETSEGNDNGSRGR